MSSRSWAMQGLAMGVVKRFTDDEGYDDDSPDPVRVRGQLFCRWPLNLHRTILFWWYGIAVSGVLHIRPRSALNRLYGSLLEVRRRARQAAEHDCGPSTRILTRELLPDTSGCAVIVGQYTSSSELAPRLHQYPLSLVMRTRSTGCEYLNGPILAPRVMCIPSAGTHGRAQQRSSRRMTRRTGRPSIRRRCRWKQHIRRHRK